MERELNLEERLAAELGWLQKLARSLIRDAGVADDVVQDVLLDRLNSPFGGNLTGRPQRCAATFLGSSRREHSTSGVRLPVGAFGNNAMPKGLPGRAPRRRPRATRRSS
mgnify:CR=1 FL=1